MKPFVIPFFVLMTCLCACHTNNTNNVTPTPGIWGDLSVQIRSSDSNFLIPNIADTLATAQFYSAVDAYWSRVAVTSIAANGRMMDDNGDTQYVDVPGPGVGTHILWDVVGGVHVPNFSYDDIGTFPQYTGPAMPDTIVRANGFTMSFPAATMPGSDAIAIVFDEYGRSIYKFMDSNRNVVFTPQELAVLPAGPVFVNLQANRTTFPTFNGKQFFVSKERIYMRTTVLL